ncbi:heparinase II/III-family protein [Photobacterium sp. TY1-4]|uniref:heparinase II/III-family protein n=1 Tax=Photobacterium sp. TY1-4 TaxID=2899122 RepID=UPI0021C0BB4B|nr:heparinase II/III-family protein [Photobacterium sp. TY1-4]UXI04191.1 heparinase II/III-family protein [Photobacterium sp. TY1-4]
MKIFTIDESTKNPLELTQVKGHLWKAPQEVEALAKNGKLWHLIGWHDSKQFGFYHKRKAVTINLREVEIVSINYMTRAKGKGWVALEVKYHDNVGVYPILESKTYKKEALEWCMEKIEVLQEAIGLEIEVNNYGHDC